MAELTRRQFVRGLAPAGLVGVSATSAYASLVEPRAYELTETDILIHELPPACDGFRIAPANPQQIVNSILWMQAPNTRTGT